jgi:hypothetical protein
MITIYCNFRRENWRFPQKPMLWSKFRKSSSICNKNLDFFAKFVGENVLIIITSVPGYEITYLITKQRLRQETSGLCAKLAAGNRPQSQGCHMVYFRTKIPILDKFLLILKLKVLVYFMALWSVLYNLWFIGIFWVRLVYFSRFGMLYDEKSGSTA